MSDVAVGERPRSLWLTIPLHVVLVAVMVLDLRAAGFWGAVGGSLGLGLAAAAGVVVLLLGALLVADVRRQWQRHRSTA